MFERRHIALGLIQSISMLLIFHFRRRLVPPELRRVVLRLIGIGLIFAPLIGPSIYTNFSDHLPLGPMTLQVLYAMCTEVLLTYYVVKLLFTSPGIETRNPDEGTERLGLLSAQEARSPGS
ncbi:MAG: hypothetical protein JW852_12270 [Spirochaetales bacterium]|nr:hypothetical protein [Spirochaetales bacterium]